jgi:hypothetical protein
MGNGEKKIWNTPKLTILVRNNNNELYLLDYCKDAHSGEPSNSYLGCMTGCDSQITFCELTNSS